MSITQVYSTAVQDVVPHSNSFMDGEQDKRVLWLINHTTLREFEVPLLRRLGFEVYCPKRFPRNPDNRSASVSYEFDNSLSLPQDELELLNQFDFYSDRFPPRIREILNKRFGSAIVAYMFPMFDQVLQYFSGRILLRTFGSTHPTYTYYSFANEVADPGFERRLARVSQRFWFAQAYPNLKQIEPPFVQRRAVDLPLGLPSRITEHRDSWTGGDPRILFVCPEIETYDESKEIYQQFKKHFGDLGHAICGAQSKPVGDPMVLGKVDSATYDRFFRSCNVMFYHSQLPRHIHYHPLEAMCYGMPVVYMQQGMLGQLTNSKLPGACDTIEEARTKVNRLIRGDDEVFRKSICDSQQQVFRLFTEEYALERWNDSFVKGIIQSVSPRGRVSARIAILPLSESAQVTELCERSAEAFKESSIVCRIGSLGPWTSETDTSKYTPFRWKVLPAESIRYAQRLSGYGVRQSAGQAIAPDDGVSDFMDYDAWLFIGDRCEYPIGCVKPYFVWYTKTLDSPALPIDDSARSATASFLQNACAILVSSDQIRDHLMREYQVGSDWITVLSNTTNKKWIGEDLCRVIQSIP